MSQVYSIIITNVDLAAQHILHYKLNSLFTEYWIAWYIKSLGTGQCIRQLSLPVVPPVHGWDIDRPTR